MSEQPYKPAKGSRPETDAKYRAALKLYATTVLSCVEICRQCGVSLSGFSSYVGSYHRHLMLQRNGIKCDPEEARHTRISSRPGQRPETHAKYKEAIAACDSIDHIGCNVSEIARKFGLNGSNLSRQLYVHYPEVLEFRERARRQMGLDDGLPRGSRPWSKEQYAEALALLQSDRYITVQEAAELCNVSYTGLEQHLIFYHKNLVDDRIRIRKEAVRRQHRGEITGRGTIHAPAQEITEKYAQALHLYRTTPMSARKIALLTGVSVKGFYDYLHIWHNDVVCERRGIPYEEGKPVDWSTVRRYNPATAAKYAEAISRLKGGGLKMAEVAAELGLHPECLRQYLKEHEPQLHAALGMKKTENGGVMAPHSMEKYKDALQLYATTTESLKSLARRFGFNDCSFSQFIKRQFPEIHEQHNKLLRQMKNS